ncbi:ABC transporter substrate-binding protein [Saccharothrix obliqua]|uniref:ABC transporter substrate-binding protein n=1 Tax=Saccharothrix obliqua TaxID=2861747 RepID=UPI001C5F0260|nr:ABC transporter substrate-binding protein [Saccharothrix obliqua]MBW4721704.1 ABC transporter substrate-binding protein [Saccharothrix obliqua]
MAKRLALAVPVGFAVCAVAAVLSAAFGAHVEPARGATGRITFVDAQDLSANRRIKQRVEEWNAHARRHEQVTYVSLPTPTDAYRAQLVARAQDLAGARGDVRSRCYDVVALDAVWTAEFAEAGRLAPLPREQFDVDRFLPASLESATVDRRLWAVPWRADVGVLYYRSDVLAAEGVGPPTSWPELERMARDIAPRHRLHGYVGQLGRYEGLTVNALEAVWAHGGDATALDSPAARAGVEMLARGLRDGWIPQDALNHTESEALAEFSAGRALFMRNWPYAREQLAASPLSGSFGMAALPGHAALGGWNLAVSRCSAHQATAWAFIHHLTTDDVERALLEQGGYPPTLRALYDDPALNARLPHLTVLRAALEAARNRPATAHYDEVTRLVQAAVHSALGKPQSIESELRRLAVDVKRAFSGR